MKHKEEPYQRYHSLDMIREDPNNEEDKAIRLGKMFCYLDYNEFGKTARCPKVYLERKSNPKHFPPPLCLNLTTQVLFSISTIIQLKQLAIPEVGEPQEVQAKNKNPKSHTNSNNSSKLSSPRFYNIRVDEMDKYKKTRFRRDEEDSSSKSNDTIKEEEEKGEAD